MNFSYTAIDARGATIKERVQADSEDQALRRLQSQGYVVTALQPVAGSERGGAAAGAGHAPPARGFFALGGQRVKLEQVAVLTRQFAIMIETGVPVTEALDALREHADSPAIARALSETLADLAGGKTISQAMSAHPRVFPKLYVDMVRTAETGGSLDETLNQAADYLEASLEMRRKVSGALTYPAVLLFVALGVLVFMMTYLLPKFSGLFGKMSANIPASTRFLMAASTFLTTHWWTIPLTLVGAVWGTKTILKIPRGRDAVTRIVHRIPVVGDVVKKVAMARLLRALGTLSGTGISLLVALETAGQTSQDSVYERAMSRIKNDIEDGLSLSEAVRDARVFPPMVCQMMAVGEKSGRLTSVLVRVAGFYERDVDARLKTLTSVIEPVMIVVLGLMVGFIAISIIAPIYSMVGSVK